MRYILGLGLSGAIAAHYLPSFKVIAKPNLTVVSGGPMYLYDTPSMRELVAEYDVPQGFRQIQVGYWMHGWWAPPDDMVLKKYYQTTRGSMRPDKEWLHQHKKTTFVVMKATPTQLYSALMTPCIARQITDEVQQIDVTHRYVYCKSGKFYHYSKLVSTIPLPILSKLIPDVAFPPLEWQPTYAEVHRWDTSPPIWESDYDYVCMPGTQPHRITKFAYPNVWAEYCAEQPPPDNGLVRQYFPFGKIVSGKAPDLRQYGIWMLGRYAQWQRGMMAHDVIEEAKRLVDELR